MYVGNILIVDDTPGNLDLLIDILETNDYEVRVARCGTRALAAVGAAKAGQDDAAGVRRQLGVANEACAAEGGAAPAAEGREDRMLQRHVPNRAAALGAAIHLPSHPTRALPPPGDAVQLEFPPDSTRIYALPPVH